MNKKTLVKCGVAGLLCLVALSAAVVSFSLHQTKAAAPASPPSNAGSVQGDVIASEVPTITFNAFRHWTKARMKAAHSAEELLIPLMSHKKATNPTQATTGRTPQVIEPVPPSDGQNSANVVAGRKGQSSHATPVTQPDTYPYSTVGKIFFTYNETDYVCSGTAMASENESTIDTAGHCVAAGGTGHFYTNWVFCARYSDTAGCDSDYMWAANKLFTHANWAKHAWLTYDYGEAVVNPNSSTNSANAAASVVEAIGGAGAAYDQPAQQQYTALGYPQAASPGGAEMWECQSGQDRSDQPNAAGLPTSGIACDMMSGSSGGGWLISQKGKFGYVNGHNDYKYSNDDQHIYSPYYGDDWYKVYSVAQSFGAE